MGRRDVNRGHAKTKETECIRGFGEPDGKTGGNDGVGCVGEVICIYPYVPLEALAHRVEPYLFPATEVFHLSPHLTIPHQHSLLSKDFVDF